MRVEANDAMASTWDYRAGPFPEHEIIARFTSHCTAATAPYYASRAKAIFA